jgi:predicted enzyme related to lactoylglutathione lyase
MPNIAHFAINADDVPRARRFYEQVFGWTFSAWARRSSTRSARTSSSEAPGILGALQGRRDLVAGQPTVGFE